MVFAVIVTLVSVATDASAQSRFDQIRDAVHEEPVRESSNSQPRCSHGHPHGSCSLCDDETDIAGSILSSLFAAVFFPDNDDDSNDVQYRYDDSVLKQTSYFAHYPYADGFDGYLMNESFVPARPQTGAMQIRFHYASDFDDIDRWTTSLLLETSSRWGVNGDLTLMTEDLGARKDELFLGDVNVLYRLAGGERAILRAGLGTNWLHDAGSTDFGINGTVLLDVFPAKPITWSSQFDLGSIRSASTVHLESSLGWSWEHIEIFAGYDYRRIGSVDLAGPMFGIRGWW